jgi:RES domain-containing protein
MILWRISNYADLEGKGGLVSSGRWHTRGHPIVYLAETPPGALIEALVHLELNETDLPDAYQLLKVSVPSNVKTEKCNPTVLGENWTADAKITRLVGDDWLRRRVTPLLRVPSAVVPETWNWLLNPAHPQARRMRISWARRY